MTLRISILQRINRARDWVPAGDIYEAYGCNGRSDKARHNRIAVSIRRLRAAGFLEVDASSRPWRYRITEAGVRELEVLSSPVLRARRVAEQMGRLRALRWPSSSRNQVGSAPAGG